MRIGFYQCRAGGSDINPGGRVAMEYRNSMMSRMFVLFTLLLIFPAGIILQMVRVGIFHGEGYRDRKSTRLNSSHVAISYAVFCLKEKTNINGRIATRQDPAGL